MGGNFSIFASARVEKTLPRIKIPYLPPQVDPEDLTHNGTLLTDDEIDQIKRTLRFEANGYCGRRYSKHELEMPFGAIKVAGQLFAPYYGKKKRKDLGEGSSGITKLVTNLDTHEWFVNKVLEDANIEDVKKEYEVLRALRLTTPRPIATRTSPSKKIKQDNIIMALAPGKALGDWLRTEQDDGIRLLMPIERLQLGIKILEEIKYFHEHFGRVHRDIKCENIICDLVESVKLIDFALAERMDLAGQFHGIVRGTPIHLTPKLRSIVKEAMIRGDIQFYDTLERMQGTFDKKTDTYAAGVVLADLFHLLDHVGCTWITDLDRLSRNAEFWDVEKNYIANDKHDPLFSTNNTLDESPKRETLSDVLDLIQMMTSLDPAKIPSLDDAIKIMKYIKKSYFYRCREANIDIRIKVGLIDVDHYLKTDAAGRIGLLLECENFNEIWLIDTIANRDLVEYSQIKHLFERFKSRVGSEVFIVPPSYDPEQTTKNIKLQLVNSRCLPFSCQIATKIAPAESKIKINSFSIQ